MIGRIQCRNLSNNAGKFNCSKANKSVPPVSSNKCANHENFMKKTNSRRRRAEIRSIKRAQRHLLIDGENRTPIQHKKNKKETENVKVKKKKKRNCNGRRRGVSLTSCSDDLRNIFSKTEENSDNDMSDHSGGGQMPVKKRGHQHHPRFAGQRRSNVPAEEVLAALRRGGIVEMSNIFAATADILIDTPPQEEEEGEGQQIVDITGKEKESYSEDCCAEMTTSALNDDLTTGDSQEDFNRNVIGCDAVVVRDEENNPLSEDTATSALPEPLLNLDSSSTSLPSSCSLTPTDDINLTQVTTKPKSSKSSSRDKSKDTTKSPKSDEKRRRRQRQRDSQHEGEFPKQERSAGDGAPADDNENDPEAEEWARLRCTSERAEVIAEREIRKHKARCADYPGLAFGRSIFSSDTMMKFNIIRNELHNIMKTQLKRVNDCSGSRNL